MFYQKVVKPVLFQMDPEKAHHLTIRGMRVVGQLPGATRMLDSVYGTKNHPELAQHIWGINFSNPIGLAAGLDKNGEAVRGFSSIGFGFMEVGTITPKPQLGNDKPRLFRLPEDGALINRMGFNNVGIDAMAANLNRAGHYRIPVAVNIGKNKSTPNEQAEDDYRKCIQRLYSYGDFFVVNISSPNTPDLRNLQHGDDLRRLLGAVKEEMSTQQRVHRDAAKPILVKIAPDLSEQELEIIAGTIVESGVSGIIASNTTIGRDGLKSNQRDQAGGLSGTPLTLRSTQVVRSVYRLTQGKLPIIGCGGIFTAQHAYEKIRAGASLVEVYTALVYEGPQLLRTLTDGLADLLRRDGFTNLTDAVGVDA